MVLLRQWQWEILAPLIGLMLSRAFAPYGFGYLTLISLVLFYGLCLGCNPVRSALRGYLFGLGLFGFGIWWVYISIHDFGGAGPFSALLISALLVALCAIFPALTAFLSAKLLGMTGVWFRISAIPLVWVGVEYLRGFWLLNGFPWLQIAYSQLNTPLSGYAPLLGVYGIGFLLAASAMTLIEIRRKKLIPLHGLVFMLMIWGGGWVLQFVSWTQAAGQPIKVALVQGNITQDLKWQPDYREQTLALYQELTEQHWDADLIVWPETAIPAFFLDVKTEFLEPLAQRAERYGVDIIISVPSRGEGKAYYNSATVLSDMNRMYHKNHLLPFGEYLPLQPLSGWVLDRLRIPLGNFAAGTEHQPLLSAGGHAFVTTICYEDAFAELVTRQVENAGYLVNMTNDAWFGDSEQPHQHMQMAQMRALETGRYLLRATNTGLTAIVLPDGKIQNQLPLFVTGVLTGNLQPMTGTTPYVRLGDRWLFALLIVLVWGIYRLIHFKSGR